MNLLPEVITSKENVVIFYQIQLLTFLSQLLRTPTITATDTKELTATSDGKVEATATVYFELLLSATRNA
jgi:hypothetical protein